MGWARHFFPSDFRQQLDIEDQRRAIERVRNQQNRKDRSQDQTIAELEAEVSDLKLYIGGLCQLMVQKGVLSEAELDRLAVSVYPPPPPTSPPRGDSPLHDLERAVDEHREG